MASSSSSSPEISAAPTTITADNSSDYSTLDDVLEDLSSRFILNLPDSELASVERICFQVEQAHWFYEDFVREGNPQFPSLPLKRFSQIFFHACPVLHQWSSDFEIAFNNFMQYKTRVPVCGAIMLNDTWEKCILVKGWKSSAGWGFPKGKINQDEERHKCAIREVYEETGYDLTGQIDTENVIELSIKQQKISLYIVPGVPEDYPFKTRTRKEISKIDWFKLSDLPTWKKSGTMSGKFYLISPFILPLKNFIQDRKPSSLKRRARRTRNAIPFTNGIAHPDESTISRVDSPPPAHSIPDSTTQESSSQSSYADNNFLQTPSPQYSQPRLNEPYVSNPTSSLALRTEDAYHTLPESESDLTPHPDAHLARLMESLSMSVLQNGSDIAKSAHSPLSTKHAPPSGTSATPVPLTASSTSFHPFLEPTDTTDWSSHAPRRVSDRHSSVTSQPLVAAGISSGRPAYNPVHIDTALTPSIIHSSASSVRPTSVLQSSISSSSPQHQRSVSVLSFAASRSAEMTPAVKRMKHLALLESVVDESARMTPTLEQSTGRVEHVTTNAHGPSMSRHPTLMPSMQGMPPVFEQSVLYSSESSSTYSPTCVPPLPPRNPPPLPFDIGEDPFVVRPRNGDLAVHMHPQHRTHNRVRQSMNETQLAPMLQRQQNQLPDFYRSQLPNYATPPLSPYVSTPVSHQHLHLPAKLPLQVASTQNLSGTSSFPSGTAPASTQPLKQGAQPSRNAKLLSILNANGTNHHSIGLQPNSMTIPPVRVVNGIIERR